MSDDASNIIVRSLLIWPIYRNATRFVSIAFDTHPNDTPVVREAGKFFGPFDYDCRIFRVEDLVKPDFGCNVRALTQPPKIDMIDINIRRFVKVYKSEAWTGNLVYVVVQSMKNALREQRFARTKAAKKQQNIAGSDLRADLLAELKRIVRPGTYLF
jgi:hypothetical protein